MGNCTMIKRKDRDDGDMGKGEQSSIPALTTDDTGTNGVSQSKRAKEGIPTPTQACFGAGCYWGTEQYIKNKLGKAKQGWIVSGQVGFMGPDGSKPNPSYKEGKSYKINASSLWLQSMQFIPEHQ